MGHSLGETDALTQLFTLLELFSLSSSLVLFLKNIVVTLRSFIYAMEIGYYRFEESLLNPPSGSWLDVVLTALIP